jgi:hypothetical protein
MLVKAANETAEIRVDIAPLDLLRAIVGVATIRPSPDWKMHSLALVELLLGGAVRTE